MSENQDLPIPDQSRIAFVYNGQTVTFDENRFIDVTQMWRASGSPPMKKFAEWRRYSGATFITDLAKEHRVGIAHLIRVTRGGGSNPSSTSAHWQVALAYAKYLSNEFHRFVNEAFREWAEEKANPDLKVDRAVDGYRRKGWDDQRIAARVDGVVQRKLFTDTLKVHGVQGSGYALCTDAINKEVLGGSAKEIKLSRGVPAKAVTRDHLETYELAGIRFAEAMASKRMTEGCTHGSGPCCKVCREAGEAVGSAMVKMGLAPVGR